MTATSSPFSRNETAASAAVGVGQLNELPQPQVWVAFGFVMWNPASCSPSV